LAWQNSWMKRKGWRCGCRSADSWLIAVGGALAGFAACWVGLAIAHEMNTGTQVGVASVPLAVVLAGLGAWAERARERSIDLVGVWADPPATALGVASVRINVRATEASSQSRSRN
jgi:hypothetical protein